MLEEKEEHTHIQEEGKNLNEKITKDGLVSGC